jgi:hypothetical protein
MRRTPSSRPASAAERKEHSVAGTIGSTDLSSKAGLAVPQLLKFLDLLAPASALFFWREDLSK